MKEFLLKLFLGNHASSSTAGYLVLALTVYQQLNEAGFDVKLALLGVGIFFVLRFLNESVPSLSPLLDEVLRLRKGVDTVRQQTAPSPLVVGELLTAPVLPDETVLRLRERVAALERQQEEVRVNAETDKSGLAFSDTLRRDL